MMYVKTQYTYDLVYIFCYSTQKKTYFGDELMILFSVTSN